MADLADTCRPRDSVTELSLDKRAKVLEETCSVWRTLDDKCEILVTNPNCLSTTSCFQALDWTGSKITLGLLASNLKTFEIEMAGNRTDKDANNIMLAKEQQQHVGM